MSDDVLWPREPHTAAKHELLRAFFNTWLSIHSATFDKLPLGGLVRVYDGFAGPGVYANGEPGSPAILMRTLFEHHHFRDRWKSVRYSLHFVEKDPRRAKRLNQELSNLVAELGPDQNDRVTWQVTCGSYEDHVPQAVAGHSALFLFLDPFGYSHAPMTLTKALVQQPRSDTLIFLPLSFVHRFTGREGQDEALDRFFGTNDWRQIPNGQDRPTRLLELFLNQLREAGLKWAGAFRLKPDPSNAYFIVGASGNRQGWTSIKEGFWAVDEVNGHEFQAAPPPSQDATLFGPEEIAAPQANTAPLLDILREAFGGRWFTVEEALDVTAASRFLEKRHLKERTLAPAERSKVLEVQRPTGARRFKTDAGIRLRFR